jgi:hypothetical protein
LTVPLYCRVPEAPLRSPGCPTGACRSAGRTCSLSGWSPSPPSRSCAPV